MIPCYSLRLEVEVPDPALNYFIINQDIIGGDKVIAPEWVGNTPLPLPTPLGGSKYEDEHTWLFWDDTEFSCLDLTYKDKCGEDPARTWGEVRDGDVCDDIIPPIPPEDDAREGYIWVDVISDATDITIERGFDVRQSVVGRPEVGKLTARVLNPSLSALDAGTAQIGSRVRLRAYDFETETSQTIFTGVSYRIATTDVANEEAVVEVNAVDVLAQLNGVLIREGRPAETYKERMEYACSQVETLEYSIEEGHDLTPVRLPLTALELLHTAQDSEGSLAFVNRNGHLYATNRSWSASEVGNLREAPKFAFTNDITEAQRRLGFRVEEDVICLSGWRQTNDTADVINGITFTNYEDEILNPGEEDEEVISRGTNYPFTDDGSAKLFGSSSIRLTTYLDPIDLPSYADQVFDEFASPRTKVEAIEFPADNFQDLSFPETITIDVGDEVRVVLKDPARPYNIMTNSTQRVAKIKHLITPEEWLVQAELL